MLEAFANIEMSVSGCAPSAAGEGGRLAAAVRRVHGTAEVSGSFEPFALSGSIGREEADGDTAASANPVLSLNVSAELSSKLGLEAQGSVTLGSLPKLDAEGRAEVGASAEVSARRRSTSAATASACAWRPGRGLRGPEGRRNVDGQPAAQQICRRARADRLGHR